jgi:hypothetical protein
MSRDDFPAFAVELGKTGELFGEVLSESRIAVYFEALAELPIGTVQRGLALARQRCKFFPKPGDVYELVVGTPADEAEVAWSRFLDAARRIGSYDSVDFGDEALHETVRVIWGGWDQTWRLETAELPYKHAEFLKTYRAMAKRGLPPGGPMLGLTAIENAGRGYYAWVPKPINLTGRDAKALPPAPPALAP